MEIAAQQRGENPKALRIYLCSQCGQYHFTSQPKLRRREERDAE